MQQKYRSFNSDTRFVQASNDDVSDALYHSIKSLGLPYSKSVLKRVTSIPYDEGEVLMDWFLDYKHKTQLLLVRARFIYAVEGDVCVQRFTVEFRQGKDPVPMIATAW